jgi:DinB superfamily
VDSRIQPLTGILELNSSLFRRALAGVDQAAGERRPNDHTNSLAFVACHVLDARFSLMKLVGQPRTNPWQSLFDSATDVTSMKEFPPLYELLAEWDELHEATIGCLSDLSPADLDAESPFRVPTEDRSILGTIAFLAFHEAYHVGQMGLLRKYFGFDPVVKR